MEPACAFFQKAAVEKSISEIDKRLATEFDLRKHARNNGMRYYDSFVFANHVQSHLIWIRKTITPPPLPKKKLSSFPGWSIARTHSFKNEWRNSTANSGLRRAVNSNSGITYLLLLSIDMDAIWSVRYYCSLLLTFDSMRFCIFVLFRVGW